MNIIALCEHLEELKKLDTIKGLRFGKPEEYRVKERWFRGDSQIPSADKNGLYFYSDYVGEVLYIGKGGRSSDDGIGIRSCAHLGKAVQNSSPMFVNHEWTNDSSIKAEVRDKLSEGEFSIWTVVVPEKALISLCEVFLQTVTVVIDRKLPPLNKQIG